MPNHVIRDRIWVSKKLAQCSLKAALAYPWIFLVADDWGRFEYRPRVIWGLVFGAREDVSLNDVANWLAEYEKVGLLERYHIEGDLAAWTNFEGRPPTKRRVSLYPDPEQFRGIGTETGADRSEDRTGPLPLAEQSRAEIEQSGEGASAPPKFAVRRKPDTASLNRAVIDAYNRVMECRIGYTAGNLEAAARATNRGYSLEQIEAVFKAVQEKRTPTAKWCAENNHSFEYLTRPPYKGKQGVVVHGPLDKIPNEQASDIRKPAEHGTGEAARMTQALAAKAARKAAEARG
jgi:hypothetical protein